MEFRIYFHLYNWSNKPIVLLLRNFNTSQSKNLN